MRIKCEYCGNFLPDELTICTYCGAELRTAAPSDEAPHTIEELKEFCERRHIPLEKAHFHIGENYTGPMAFGIYKDEYGFFTVYKNKSDGSRLVRYHGIDEDFAVNEIFQKIRSVILVKKR